VMADVRQYQCPGCKKQVEARRVPGTATWTVHVPGSSEAHSCGYVGPVALPKDQP
jgi:hypothetical protein